MVATTETLPPESRAQQGGPSEAVAKVVQRMLGHASAAMTVDPHGHLVDHNLWASARVRGHPGASEPVEEAGREGGQRLEGL